MDQILTQPQTPPSEANPPLAETPTPAPPPPKSPIPLNPILILITFFSLLLTGFFIYQNWLTNQKLQQLIESQTVSPTSTSALEALVPPADPTADWLTYNGLGFAIKFPAGWQDLQNACFKINIAKSDAIDLELNIKEYLNNKIGDPTEVESLLSNGREKYSVLFGNIPSSDVAILGPLGEGEINNIVIRGPEGTGYYDISVVYVGPVPDINKVCTESSTKDGYKEVLSTFRTI